MKNTFIKRLRSRRGGGFGTLAVSATLLALLQGCGGGDGSASTSTQSSAKVDTKAAEVVAVDADVRQKAYFAGSTKGFVAKALSSSLPAGTADNYDILVIGDADKSGKTTLDMVRKALENGKEVVFDAASDGSARPTHTKILQTLVGTSIDSDAVRVQKGETGYYVTPIDAPEVAAKKTQGKKEGESNVNSVQNVFGVQASEAGK